MKQRIRDFALQLGVDDVGFAAVTDYLSPLSPKIESIFPAARSIVVLAYKEPSNCESPNPQIAMNGRMDVMEFARTCDYRVVRFLEGQLGAKAMSVPTSFPLPMKVETRGAVADVSLRHAAVAAGLGGFGRHNLVLHPRFGTRVTFTAVLSDLDLSSDPPAREDLCDNCDLCVAACPSGALNEEGKTDVLKCLRNSQPYGLSSNIRFWIRFVDSTPEDRKMMLRDVEYWRLYQSAFIGFQYYCFECMTICPVGQR